MDKPKILVVDDEVFIRETFSDILEGNGYLVATVENGTQALEITKTNQFNICILDIGLPDADGIDIMKHLKKDFPEMACILCTGRATLDNAVGAIHYGADAYLIKPISIKDLLIKLEDIWEKARMRHEIDVLNELPKTILNSINEAISIINAEDFSLVSANKVFLQTVGLPEEEVLGRPCYEVTHNSPVPCTREDGDCPLRDTLLTGDHSSVEHVHYDKDNNPIHVEISTSPIKDSNGQVVQVVHVARDITERKKLEISLAEERQRLENAMSDLSESCSAQKKAQTQIVQQEKMASIGQLAAGVAHEINNPVGFVNSNLISLAKYTNRVSEYIQHLEKVAEKLAPEVCAELNSKKKELKVGYIIDDMPELIQESLEGTERVKKIVQNLKTFSRVDDAKQTESNINECLESTLNIVWNELKYKAEVNKDYTELPLVRCFPQQINQVFMNLLVNAAHSIEDRGTINIKTGSENRHVSVSITDSGCGIPEENLLKIFDPFFTTKEIGKGTGLGMSIAYDIIKKHNGDITVESTVGKGTTFTVKLPVAG